MLQGIRCETGVLRFFNKYCWLHAPDTSYICTRINIVIMRTKLIIGLMAVAVALTACNKTKTEEPVPAEEMLTPGERVVEGVSQLEVSHTSDTVTWHGKVYRYDIVREPDDSLPKVKMDETGTLFTDNHIDVKVTCEGKQVFSRRFYKSSFNSYLPEDFRTKGILEGFVFDTTVSGGLQFGTSICYPRSEDFFIPLTVIIAPDGGMTIRKDDLMDGANNEEGV